MDSLSSSSTDVQTDLISTPTNAQVTTTTPNNSSNNSSASSESSVTSSSVPTSSSSSSSISSTSSLACPSPTTSALSPTEGSPDATAATLKAIQDGQAQWALLKSHIVALLCWKDMTISSISFCSGLLFFFLLGFGDYSVLTLTSYLFLLQLLVCFILVNFSKVFVTVKGSQRGQTHTQEKESVFKLDFLNASIGYTEYISLQTLQQYLSIVHYALNLTLNWMLYVIRCQSNPYSLKVMLVLILTASSGRIIDGVSMAAIVWLLLWSVPFLSVRYPNQWAQYSQSIQDHMNQIIHSLQTKSQDSSKPKNE